MRNNFLREEQFCLISIFTLSSINILFFDIMICFLEHLNDRLKKTKKLILEILDFWPLTIVVPTMLILILTANLW